MSYIQSITLTNFRCYKRLDLRDLPKGLIVLYGENGAGKTNILEALSMLTPGRGLRSAKPYELQRRNITPDPSSLEGSDTLSCGEREGARGSGKGEGPRYGGWAVASEINNGIIAVKIGTGLDPKSDKRIVRINGETMRAQASLSEYLSCIWMTPQMDRLFLDASRERRKFLDRLVFSFDPGHAGRLTRYENAMRQRSRILTETQARGQSHDPQWVSALESQMAETGVAIAAARLDFAQRLQESCKTQNQSAFPHAHIAVKGTLEDMLENAPALEIEEFFRMQLAQSRGVDALTGGAAVGPHKSDLTVIYAEKKMDAASCSTGEQKALLTGLIIAHARLVNAERGAPPILFMDEVAAHLDENRRNMLYEILRDIGAQVWLTGTDQALFSAISDSARMIEIRQAQAIDLNGKNKPQNEQPERSTKTA